MNNYKMYYFMHIKLCIYKISLYYKMNTVETILWDGYQITVVSNWIVNTVMQI